MQVNLIYFKFETKIDFWIDKNDLTLPMVSFCRPSNRLIKDFHTKIVGVTPAQLDNNTFDFDEIFVSVGFYHQDEKLDTFGSILDFKKQTVFQRDFNPKWIIKMEKTMSYPTICYNFKYPNNKLIKPKWINGERTIFRFVLYHSKLFNYKYPFNLSLSANDHYPNSGNEHFYILTGFLWRLF